MGCISGTIFGCTVAASVLSGGTYTGPDYSIEYLDEQDRVQNTKHLYTDEQTNWYLNGSVTNLETQTRYTLGYDNGIDQNKYDRTPEYTIGIDQVIDLTDNSYLIAGATYSYGAKETHHQCYGDKAGMTEKFSCFNPGGIETTPPIVDHKTKYSIGIKYVYKF